MNNRFGKTGKLLAVGSLVMFVATLMAGQYKTYEETWNADWDTDPAFRIYQQNREYYREYEYMFHAGEEGLEISMEGSPQAEMASAETAVTPDPAVQEVGATVRHLPAQLADYDYLMNHFYNVHSSTTAGRELMNAEKFLNRDFALKEQEGPQILIYHTHSQETYADFGPDRPDANVVTVGEELTRLLREKGYTVIHDTTVYDLRNRELDRNKAYTYALEGITGILQQNPSIQVILDVHRDGVKEGLHLAWDYEGQTAAQIMFFQGTSRTPDGPIEYLSNPYVEDNMAFTFQMQMGAAEDYPGLTRKIYLKGLRYNLHLRPRSALIEVGAQTNTVDEALLSMTPLSDLLDRVLQGK